MRGSFVILLATAAAATVTACATPKVLVDNAFVGEKRTAKIVIKRNDASLFDEFVRVCTLEPGATETGCQDTLILNNVTP